MVDKPPNLSSWWNPRDFYGFTSGIPEACESTDVLYQLLAGSHGRLKFKKTSVSEKAGETNGKYVYLEMQLIWYNIHKMIIKCTKMYYDLKLR